MNLVKFCFNPCGCDRCLARDYCIPDDCVKHGGNYVPDLRERLLHVCEDDMTVYRRVLENFTILEKAQHGRGYFYLKTLKGRERAVWKEHGRFIYPIK